MEENKRDFLQGKLKIQHQEDLLSYFDAKQ